VQQDINVQCDSSLASVIVPSATNVSWDDAVGGFQPINLNGATSQFTYVNYPPTTTVWSQFTWFELYNGIETVGPVTNAWTYTPKIGMTRVELTITDGCHFSTSFVNITGNCQTVAPVIAAVTSPVNSGTPVALSAAGTPRAGFLAFTWTVISAPAGSAAAPTPPFGQATSITPIVAGTYVIQVLAGDGCTTNTTTVSFTVQCTQPLSPVASASVMTVNWNQNAFDRIDLDGNASVTGPTNVLSAIWTISGPINSVYYAPQNLITILSTNSTNTQNVTNATDVQYVNMFMRNFTTTTYDSYTITLPAATNPLLRFPTCFYPDVDGTYTLTLTLTDTCHVNTSTIQVNARCQAAPTIMFKAHERELWNSNKTYVNLTAGSTADNVSYDITLNRNSVRRIVLNATGSAPQSNSKLEYYWSWRFPDPRANTAGAQNDIDSPFGAAAEVILPKIGTYYMLLTVHDGCVASFLNITLNAKCDSSVPTLNVGNQSTTTTDGVKFTTLVLQNTAKNQDGSNQLQCDDVVSWAFMNFTEQSPTGPKYNLFGAANAVSSTVFVWVSLIAATLFVLW